MKKFVFIVCLVVLLAAADAEPKPKRGRERLKKHFPCRIRRPRPNPRKTINSCPKTPWSERCLSKMNLDLILMVERMDQARFNNAKKFALTIINQAAARPHTNSTIKLAVFTFGDGDFGVFWPTPRDDISVTDAMNNLRRVRVQREPPLTARAMRFASKFPEPSTGPDGKRRERVVVFIGSGRTAQGDDIPETAIKDLNTSRSKLLYFLIGKGTADWRFLRKFKSVATTRRLKRKSDKVLWRYLVNWANM